MTPIRKKIDVVDPIRQAKHMPGSNLLLRVLGLPLLFLLATSCLYAQAAAEYGGATSSIAGSISSTNLMKDVKVPDMTSSNSSVIMSQPSKDSKANSNYIFDSMRQGSISENRKDLERRAGKNAAKLMLRSTPTDAYVKINGKLVGKTPILLVVPPGQYEVSVYGKRMDQAEQKVDLLPKETREFQLPLKQLYPTQVTIKLH